MSYKYAQSGKKRYYSRGNGSRKGPRTVGRYTPTVGRIVRIQPRQRGYLRRGGFYGRFANGGEMKFFDTDVTDASITLAQTINNLTIIPQNNTESGRVGRKIVIKKIHGKGFLILNAATVAANTSVTVKFMLVQDMQTNGAVYTGTDLLETDNIEAFRNLANSTRFKVLWSKTVNMAADGAAASGAAFVFGQHERWIVMNKSCYIPMEYDNSVTTGAIASVRSNNIYWVTQSSSQVAKFTGTVRLRYSDA